MDSKNEAGHVSFWRRTPTTDGNSEAGHRAKSVASDVLNKTVSVVSDPAQESKAAFAPFGTSIGTGSHIIGQACFDGSIKIDGRLEGTISSGGRISVGKTGTIISTDAIEAAEVIIEGSVAGNIVASERIHVCASGRVVGNLSAPILAIEPGAAIEGCCSTRAK